LLSGRQPDKRGKKRIVVTSTINAIGDDSPDEAVHKVCVAQSGEQAKHAGAVAESGLLIRVNILSPPMADHLCSERRCFPSVIDFAVLLVEPHVAFKRGKVFFRPAWQNTARRRSRGHKTRAARR